MDMCPVAAHVSTSQRTLIDELGSAVDFARDKRLEGVIGYCMAAAQGVGIGNGPSDIMTDIREFVVSHVPAPARVLDVAAGTGRRSIPLAKAGYSISLFEPASALMDVAYESAREQGAEHAVTELLCGTFEDLPRIRDASYDVTICIGSILYAHPWKAAKEAIVNLARITSSVAVIGVASKYGVLLQLGSEGAEVSAGSIRQFLSTNVTPPASAENGHVVYSCFTSAELCSVLKDCGLRAERLIGYGSPGILDEETANLLPESELRLIEQWRQAKDQQTVELFPDILALCMKE
jgi:SAM-dependent methyltransferase